MNSTSGDACIVSHTYEVIKPDVQELRKRPLQTGIKWNEGFHRVVGYNAQVLERRFRQKFQRSTADCSFSN